MTLRLLLGLLTAFLFGLLFLSPAIPDRLRRLPLSLAAALAIGLGLGLTSIFFFLWRVFGGVRPGGYLPVELILLVLAAIAISLFLLKRKRADNSIGRTPKGPASLAPAAFLIVLAAALTAFAFQSLQQPHGEWDAWAIWNQHARFLYRGGAHWMDGFAPELARNHPDYPLMLPASVARTWTWKGVEGVAGPMAVAGLFMAATALALYGVVLALSNAARAMTAAVILLGTPFFISLAAYQYADGPLAFFILATLALSLMADSREEGRNGFLILSGAAAGFAAWTKNEGVLFAPIFLACRCLLTARKGGTRAAALKLRSLLIGLLPIAIVIALFKIAYAPPNDLLAPAATTPLISRLTDLSRWRAILVKLVVGGIGFGEWRPVGNVLLPVPVIMFAWRLLAGRSKERPAGIAVGWSSAAVMLLGYVGAYAVTPHDVNWHISTSLNRLLMQLWPSVIMLFCLTARAPYRPRNAAPAAAKR
jgi:hypothetical protein